jgi:peroxiredoxin
VNRRALSRLAFWAAAAVLLLQAACGMKQTQRQPMQHQPPPAGDVAAPTHLPSFRLRDTAGREFTSEQFQGKTLLINYWATWCKPCEKEMPGLQRIQDRHSARGVHVVGIAMDTDPKAVREFGQRLGIRYPLLMGTQEAQDAFGIRGLPSTYLIDRRGEIRRVVIGFEYEETVEAYLKEMLTAR